MAPQSQPEPGGVLAGVVVLERGRRLATAAVGNLLASLGAKVLRLETEEDSRTLDQAPLSARLLRASGKRRILLDRGFADSWRRCEAKADVLLFDPLPPGAPDHALQRARIAAGAGDKVLCVLSPSGLDGGDAWQDASEPLLQALAGAMSVTGDQGGAPEFVRVPIVGLTAAVVSATAVLAALRVRRRDGFGQLIDLSLIEAAADQLRLHLPLLDLDGPQEFRQGCGHPICCPWNAYHARDGWVVICSSSDAQWQALLDVIGRPDLKQDASLARAVQRRARIDEVDGLLQAWVGNHDVQQVVSAAAALGIPAGEVATIPQVVRNRVLRLRGAVVEIGGDGPLFGTALGLRRTPAQRGMELSVPGPAPSEGRPTPIERTAAHERAVLPLAGVRVVELTRYTAGPLAGMLLAGLGAEVIKIESPGGEETRRWQPQYGGVSGYFINHNAGKRSVTLDLRGADGQRQLAALVADSDVLLQNLRPGVMDKIGLGAAAATERHPRLIHATISGFGLDGPDSPALDTVIQAVGGLIALVGGSEPPCRVGFSIADQISGHFTALAILAAIIERDRSGRGQVVDIAMADAIAWATQLAWPDGRSAVGPSACWPAKDGWVAAMADEEALRGTLAGQGKDRTRAEWVDVLRRLGIPAAPVLEPAEVFAQPVISGRRSVFATHCGDAVAPVLVMPFGLTGTPALQPHRMRALGEDNAALLGQHPTGASVS